MTQIFKYPAKAALLFAACWLYVPGLGASEKPVQLPSVEALVEYFDIVVFGSEFGGGEVSEKIKKWRRPLRIVVKQFGETVTNLDDGGQQRRLKQQLVNRHYFHYVQKHLKSLVDLTGLQSQNAKATKEPANFVIYFVPPLQMDNPYLADVDRGIMKRAAAQGGCYFLSWANDESGEIKKATIVVNTAREMPSTDHCLLEEMTQSLGMPNDADAAWPSIFSSTGRIRALSAVDRIIIRTLYDPRLTQGMLRLEALRMARVVIAELHAAASR